MSTPVLERPGAGLPPLEAWFLRHIFFPLGSCFLPPPKAIARFQREGQTALRLARSLSADQLTTPVLIKRQRGMEDSSRFWSVAMTLHHLILVGEGIRLTVSRLAAGKEVDRKVSTAEVKPSPDTGPEIIEAFSGVLTRFPITLGEHPYPSSPTLIHPWFGDLSAAKWLTLAAIHQALHRKQIELIISGLPPLLPSPPPQSSPSSTPPGS